MTPLTVLIGANGSGKSTVFDALAFLHESFSEGLETAWNRRNRMAGIRSRGSDGPIGFEIGYRAPGLGTSGLRKARYQLRIEEQDRAPVVASEIVSWSTAPGSGRPREIVRYEHGSGRWYDEEKGVYREQSLASPSTLAVTALANFDQHPRVRYLRDLVSGWYLSYVEPSATRSQPESGPQRQLNKTGDNLPNVIQYLQEKHPERLRRIFAELGRLVPQLEGFETSVMPDGRLLLRLKDRAFDELILSRNVSDGTMKLLAYLTVLFDPDPPMMFGIEEPENQLHPEVLTDLVEVIRSVSGRSQVFVTTHSPEFVSGLEPAELWTISRGADGYASVARASDDLKLVAQVAAGGHLGDLWNENFIAHAGPGS
ncbi:AAA family ATPase [Tsukamurella soli]|uniref:AAA family ATPase n=1 Tax=Tsukamurella soli TaxID=644556 RepID=UPI00361F637F